jgi:hypothetical protein
MRRREFFAFFGRAVAWPITAHAQTSAAPLVGFLSSASPAPWAPFIAGFRIGLNETGFVESQNVTRCWSDRDTSSPSALAVLRLRTNSNLVGCRIGRSAGFTPFRIFPA